MYTVSELIECLKKCPADYKVVAINSNGLDLGSFESVGIDNKQKSVELFITDYKINRLSMCRRSFYAL